MKFAIAIACVLGVAVAVYFCLVPANTFITFQRPNGGGITFSRSSVSLEKAPDRYATNGISHIEPYMQKLVAAKGRMPSLSIFTPDHNRGFGLDRMEGRVHASLVIDARTEAKREAKIRAFFKNLGAEPSSDYLAGNGSVSDATRMLSYPVNGNAEQLTALAEKILTQLCGVSTNEALEISFEER
ncbi:MAG TPA: hypothetical protein VI282_16405 [Verrucomicrobiae bacterium]